jgi:replicative DNA helicase
MTAANEKQRKPLCSDDAEKAILGGLMQWPAEIDRVARALVPEDFHRPRNREIYRLILELAERGEIDAQVVYEAAEDRSAGDPQRFGGPAYILGCPLVCPMPEALPSYVRIVTDFAARRAWRDAASEIRDVALAGGTEADMAERVEAIVARARRVGTVASGPRTLAELAGVQFGEIVENYNHPRASAGIPTGFADLDRQFALNRTDFVIVAARPAMGKTAYALNLLCNMARQVPSAFFSMEMSHGQLVRRLFARETGVGTREMQTGRMDHRDMGAIEEAVGHLGQLPIWIDDTPGMHLGQLRGRVRQLKARCPELGLVFLDYIQLCQGGTNRGNRQEVVSEISRGLKVIAKEFDVGVIGLSQLNRDLEKRDDKRPMVSDLRESGSLEQDADAILLLYRDEVYNQDTSDRGVCEVIIGKQRGGNIGKARLAWNPHRQEFGNLAGPDDDGGYR